MWRDSYSTFGDIFTGSYSDWVMTKKYTAFHCIYFIYSETERHVLVRNWYRLSLMDLKTDGSQSPIHHRIYIIKMWRLKTNQTRLSLPQMWKSFSSFGRFTINRDDERGVFASMRSDTQSHCASIAEPRWGLHYWFNVSCMLRPDAWKRPLVLLRKRLHT